MAKSKNSTMMGGMDPDWQTESDVRTLGEAHRIKGDPKRLKAAKEHAKKKLESMARIASTSAVDDDGDDDNNND
jgi:hypothetical protein